MEELMRKTIYKSSDFESRREWNSRVVEKLEYVDMFLVEKSFLMAETGEECHSDFLHLVVVRGGRLKNRLKKAMELFSQSDKLLLIFEFDSIEFTIHREDKFEDVYRIIHDIVLAKRLAENELAELRNSNNANI